MRRFRFRPRHLRRDSGVSWFAVMEGQTMLASLLAGAIMLVVSILASIVAAGSPHTGEGASIYPFRLAASVLLHDGEYRDMPIYLALGLGAAVHFGLSVIFGFAFGLAMTDESGRHRGSMVFQAVMGMLLGLGLYAVNIQFIARFWYPWFLSPSQWVVAMIHVFAFGLPLGLLAPLANRRAVQRMRTTRVTT